MARGGEGKVAIEGGGGTLERVEEVPLAGVEVLGGISEIHITH